MAIINVLDKTTCNKIAAGEVVERPFSVVKELVENSIDSGATKIIVEIVNGGKKLVKVTDNGSGIEESQLENAILPHATSKIQNIEDLDHVCTLGFRGEALPSIASVSKFKITSKPENQETAFSIVCEGGETKGVFADAGADGTTVSVEDLFYNIPVRAKFLKTDKAEEGDITNIVCRLILSHPNVAFILKVNGKTVLQSYGDGIESAMVAVYGPKVIENCFFIDTIKNGIKIVGYIGKHDYTKPNRTYQSLFINNRYVVNTTVSAAITNAYAPYTMKRQYPFYSLSITMPSEIVDVNVHPTKAEVRFLNNQIIYGIVFSVISKVLDGSSQALEIVKDEKEDKILENPQNCEKIIEDYVTHNDVKNFKNKQINGGFTSVSQKNFFATNSSVTTADLIGAMEKPQPIVEDIFAQNKAYLEKLEKEQIETLRKADTKVEVKSPYEENLTYVGQALSTYLILQGGENVYFVDQHALHERIIYDKLIKAMETKRLTTQPLLLPYTFNVNSAENEFLAENLDNIRDIGIDINEFGANTYKISAVPTELLSINLKQFIAELFDSMQSFKQIKLTEIIKDKIAKTACKSAIKAGDVLTKTQIDELIEMVNGNFGLKCPHGRPVCVKLTKMEIEKWFKRIV